MVMITKDEHNGYYGDPKFLPDEVPYGETCSCNPKNGGSGICGCIIANKMVPNPKKFGYLKTNFITTTEHTLNIQNIDGKKSADDIIGNNIHINILSTLIQIVENDHPEFKEDNTTGYDLIEGAKKWLEEIKNKK